MIINVNRKNKNFLTALSSETRIHIIELLAVQPMSIKEIAAELELSSTIITKHINILEKAGILKSKNMAGVRGMKRVCQIALEHAVLLFDNSEIEGTSHRYSMPVGLYTAYDVEPTCGLASRDKIIGILDDPRYFAAPEHADAELIWFGKGWLEYQLPNYLNSNQILKSISISMELCAEAPIYNHNWPSEITFYLCDKLVGSWVCPGDFGEKRGVFTPYWWNLTQYGMLKTLIVNDTGSYIDGVKISNVKLEDLDCLYGKTISFRIGCFESTTSSGGVNIFGKGFGNYAQDIDVVLEYQEDK